MALGIGIGLYFGWKLALVVLAICPLMAGGLAMRIKYREEGATKDAELFEAAGQVQKKLVKRNQTPRFACRWLWRRSRTFAQYST